MADNLHYFLADTVDMDCWEVGFVTLAASPVSLAGELCGVVYASQHDLGEAVVCGASGGWRRLDGGGWAVDFALGDCGVSDTT